MKKILSTVLIAALLVISILPASAADILSNAEMQEIYKAYWRPKYDATYVSGKPLPSFDEYMAERPAATEHFKIFEYYGRYGEKNYPVVFLSNTRMFGFANAIIGDYHFSFFDWSSEETADSTTINGLVIYDGEKIIHLSKAYKDGLLTDSDLDALYADGRCRSILGGNGKTYPMMRLNGDMNDDGIRDINDLTSLKTWIMNERYTNNYTPPEYTRNCGDMDGNGFFDINDMIALKSRIMEA